jgi:hypothetical protein
VTGSIGYTALCSVVAAATLLSPCRGCRLKVCTNSRFLPVNQRKLVGMAAGVELVT